MNGAVRITSVRFESFKALSDFTLRLSHVNLLVGPNNCGKSTVLGAFRVLAQALRSAGGRTAVQLAGPSGPQPGWTLPEDLLPISYENIHTDYRDVDTAIEFATTLQGKLTLWFPATGGCFFFAERDGLPIRTRAEFRRDLAIDVQVVPVLGPVEHNERLVTEETVRRNISTTRASRNFRNYWLKYPGGFDQFAALVAETWPGMEIEPPERQDRYAYMFCREDRISRELYWSGFGFQIWLQLLTHIFRASESTLIVIDEPEIYLHPDVQRQLLGILRDRQADILLATHSTEIMSEADPSEIVFVDKSSRSGRRLKNIDDIQGVLTRVGSAQNITLSRLAVNRRVLFVEGDKDFRLLRRFAAKIGLSKLSAGGDMTASESGGFSSWIEVRALAAGFEKALGVQLHVAAVFDRDFWCDEQIDEIKEELSRHIQFAHIHDRKEIENYMLIPEVLERAVDKALAERQRRTGVVVERTQSISQMLDAVSRGDRRDLESQYIAKRLEYFKGSRKDSATVTREATDIFDRKWGAIKTRMEIVRGKNVLARLRAKIHQDLGVSLTDHRIINAFLKEEVPADLESLLHGLDEYRCH